MGNRKYNMKEYWSTRLEQFGEKDDLGAVMCVGMPRWYNAFFDRLERKALSKTVNPKKISGKKRLDVGCVTGRVARYYAENDVTVIGIDISPGMIEKAKKLTLSGNCYFGVMSADHIGFKENSFDVVLVVKVLQHIHYDIQDSAISEICRVVKTGGKIVIIEGNGFNSSFHVFPRAIDQWVAVFEKKGHIKNIKMLGIEYIFLLRIFNKIKDFIFLKNNTKVDDSKIVNKPQTNIFLRVFYYIILRILTYISYPLEYVSKVVPAKYSTHCCLLFNKE